MTKAKINNVNDALLHVVKTGNLNNIDGEIVAKIFSEEKLIEQSPSKLWMLTPKGKRKLRAAAAVYSQLETMFFTAKSRDEAKIRKAEAAKFQKELDKQNQLALKGRKTSRKSAQEKREAKLKELKRELKELKNATKRNFLPPKNAL